MWNNLYNLVVRAMGPEVKPHHAQLHPQAENSVAVIIGLDFGTAFSKVVIRIGTESRRGRSYAVPLASGDLPYYLPSVLHVSNAGLCLLRDASVADGRRDGLKERILDGDCGPEDEAAIVAYLALVLRRTRSYVLTKLPAEVGKRRIVWSLNLGVPAALGRPDLLALYKRLAHQAWQVSTSAGQIEFPVVLTGIGAGGALAGDPLHHEDAVTVVPEFIAQMATFRFSDAYQSGLYGVVDVGAGTVDITVFNMFENEGELRVPIGGQGVEKLGTRYLGRHRSEAFTKPAELFPAHEPVPSQSEAASRLGITLPDLEKVDAPFRNRVGEAVWAQLQEAHARYPKDAAWQGSGLPLFLYGGGAPVDIYQGVQRLLSQPGFKIKSSKATLPKPKGLKADGLPANGMSRLLVAYGLSFPAHELGEIVRGVPPDRGAGPALRSSPFDMDLTDRDQAE